MGSFYEKIAIPGRIQEGGNEKDMRSSGSNKLSAVSKRLCKMINAHPRI